MSSEGYYEILCEAGHYDTVDQYGGIPETCKLCGKPITHYCHVDETNGFEASNPDTHEGAKEIFNEERVTITRYLYRPVGTRWCEVKGG